MFAKAAITGTLQAGGPTFTAEYLVVAGGGGSGVGGGGAGGYQEGSLDIALSTPYAVTVGAGGTANTDPYSLDNAQPGASSTFNVIVSAGGGKGGGHNDPGGNGGSGGGTGSDITSGAGAGNTPATTPAQGFNGGASNRLSYGAGGGGGGATTRGFDATTGSASVGHGGDGGQAKASSITGTTVYYAGGGGGGCNTNTVSATGGGLGGRTTVTAEKGGAGDGTRLVNGAGSNGVANTGGGAGGAEVEGPNGGNGGSGVVIIRVPSTVVAEFSAGVVYNYIPLDDFNVYEITAAGVSDTVTFSQGAVTTVGESLRFNDDDSAYLSRTPASAGNTNVFTYSGWIKLGNVDTGQKTLLSAGPDNNNRSDIWVWGNKVYFYNRVGGTTYTTIYANALLRDPSAWYHIVVKADQTKSFVDIYINGVKQETAVTSANYSVATLFNTTNAHAISRLSAFASSYFDGYMSDVYFIDGQALDPSRFGKQDADGIWQPITYTGSYGTNGFHLDFADNSTAAALGTDTSGNGNNWTPSGITTDDQVTDTPSVNYATWNPLDWGIASLADGNLRSFNAINSWQSGRGTFGVSSGKWYWEATGVTNYAIVGIATRKANLANFLGADAFGWGYYTPGGYKYNNGTLSAYGASYSGSDVVGIAFDADAGNLTFYKNGVSQGLAFSGITGETYFPAVSVYNGSIEHNFGQRPFAYTPPTGFQALNSSNLPAPTITDGKAHFQPVLYTGNGTSQTVRGLEFQPDLVWLKDRSTARSHVLSDAVRGANAQLYSDQTLAETTQTTQITAFLPNGFSVGSGSNSNNNGDNFVAWNWYAGGSTVTNTDGTITSQVRANTTAGFSIVTYNPSFSSGQSGTIGHGLSAAPQIVITKRRDIVGDWWTFVEGATGRQDDYLALNLTNAVSNAFPPAGRMTATTFTDSYDYANTSSSMVAYCFHSVDGFSKFGTYTGNGSTDGPFVYTGFRPAFVMVKASSVAGESWAIMDDKRVGYNVVNSYVQANSSTAEFSYGGGGSDILSNGFKLRSTSTGLNGSGITFIYMAFAENPFKTARAR